MTILQLSPDSSAMVRSAAAIVLYLHISVGSVGLLSGVGALILRKGSRLHRVTGKIFVISMMIMSAVGAGVAPFLPNPEWASVLAGVLTFYLVETAWTAVKRKPGAVGLFDVVALLASMSIAVASVLCIVIASNSMTGTLNGQPRQAFFLFLFLGSIAALGDLKRLLRRGVDAHSAERIARHLWRMCAALFIATASLFLGQQQVFPAALRAYLFVPVALVIAALVFWLGRVCFSATYKPQCNASNLQARSR